MIGSFVPFTPSKFVTDGDSHTFGNADPSNAWPVFFGKKPLTQSWNIYNIAKNGATAQNVADRYVQFARPNSKSITGVTSHYHLHVGFNDLPVLTGAQIYAIVAPVLAMAKAEFTTVGVTLIWGDPDLTTGQSAEVVNYNTLLLSDPSVTPGLIFDGFNLVVPWNSLPYFLVPGNHLNPTGQSFYADNVYANFQSAHLI